MKNKISSKNFLKKYLPYILLALIIPIISISALSAIIKWGTNFINTNELIIDTYEPISIGDYLGYYIAIVSIEITGLLSLALLRTSNKSNKLSEDIKNKEDKRDREAVRESALIIYYDLISNLSILKAMYSLKGSKLRRMEENKLNVVSDWVKNVANLRDILTKKELETIFNLYNSFLLLNELDNNKSDDNNEIDTLVKSLSEKIFIPALLNYLWMDFKGITESILNSQYYLILKKIELASRDSSNNEDDILYSENGEILIKQSNGNTKCKGIFADGAMKDGKDEWYMDNETLLYSFEYKNGEIISGKYINIFRDKYELVFDGQLNSSKELVNGYGTSFYSPNKIKYQGFVSNGVFDGEGKSYSVNNSLKPSFSGIWKEGEMINGEYINDKSNSILYFKGEYRNNRPYSGEIKYSELCKFKDSYGFEGIISEGKPLKGRGYKFFKDIISEGYRSENPQYDYDMDQYDYEDIHQEIPYEVEQEMYEDSERRDIQRSLENLEEYYGHVVELIRTDWDDGEPMRYEDDVLNKKYFAYSNSKIVKR